MKLNQKHLFGLLKIYLLLLVIYAIMRIAFVWYNYQDLDTSTPFAWVKTLFYGSRFDLSALLLSNLVFSFLWVLPIGSWWSSKLYQGLLKLTFFSVNVFFLALNAIDIVYFPFIKKRMQRDALLFFNGEKGNEAYTMLPVFIVQYWYVWLFLVACIYLLYRWYHRIVASLKDVPMKVSFLYLLIFPLIVGLELLGMRGGLQLRPLAVIDAAQGTGVRNVPFVLNSTFSVMRTWGKRSLDERKYFDDADITGCDRPIQEIKASMEADSEKLNVIIIMVESLSKEYLSWYHGTGKTPFLDSLMSNSLVFDNGFANARESVQGVPAVLSSIPAWMDEPFIFSKYGANNFNSLATITKTFGYKSYFFHGAARGSMGFLSFTNLAGYDGYFGKEDYPEETHFDGAWGIWDHHFLPFMADQLTLVEQPFTAAILTLNTHHPFKVPEFFKVTNPNDQFPILNSLQYVDYSLQTFFAHAAKQPWFQHTLFVITADHTGPMTVASKSTLEDYRIPIFFYKPDNSLKGQSQTIINQIDILPTVLSALGLETTVFSFGKNVWDTSCTHAHMNYKSGVYQYADEQYCLHFDGSDVMGIFDWHKDNMLIENLKEDPAMQDRMQTMENQVKKSIQVYNHAIIHNKMLPNGQ